ncbi:phage terminase large subunit [Litorivivens sp.]|uniref:phage terminase large subunit n=2 Tax=Gammaproteobacteria TaxID=1236 RepID=UPI00356374F7
MTTARIELPPKLIPVFEGEADVRGSYGGRGSGKTRSFAKMSAVKAYQWAKTGRSGIVLCCRQYMNSLDDSSLEEIKQAIEEEDWLRPHFEIGEKYIRTTCGRVSYKFSGLDRNINSVKSKSRILLCWVDEAEPVAESAWRTLIPTIRGEDSELWVTWNPEIDGSATDKRFRKTKDPLYKVVELNWRDNPAFPAILERQRQRDLETNPEYNHIWEGDYKTIVEGAYYADLISAARTAGRICSVPYDPSLPVNTFWDLGMSDQNTIWFHQQVGREHRFIDYYANHGEGFAHYAKVLKEMPYIYGTHYLPHDAEVRELTTGKHRKEVLESLGIKPVEVVARIAHINEGIEMTRQVLPMCWFDEEKTAQGVKCLASYRQEYDEAKMTFKARPLHDWASHGADAFRQFAQGYRGANTGWGQLSSKNSGRRGKKAVSFGGKSDWIV